MKCTRFSLLVATALWALIGSAQEPILLVTGTTGAAESVNEARALAEEGVDVAVIVAPGCYMARAAAGAVAGLATRSDRQVFDRTITSTEFDALPKQKRIGALYLNRLLAGAFDAKPTDVAMDWSTHPDHEMERTQQQRGRDGAGTLKSGPIGALDWTCGEGNNSEVMRGIIVASAFFLESSGAIDADQYSWTQAHIDDVKAQMIDAWSIWSYTASLNGQTVTAVMNWYEPSGGMSVQPYEPITHAGSQDYLWIDACMTNLGYTGSTFGKLDAFNRAMRTSFTADEGVCAFIAYNPPALGAPNQFTDGKIGYAYLGGPYTQLLYKANGWGTDQVNRVYGHETGHLFHAFDEYTSSGTANCSRFFNGRQNANYQGSTCAGSAACVMINNAFSGSGATRQWNLCSHTPYHLGWTGIVAAPTPITPLNGATVTANPVLFGWDRHAPPTGVYSYVRVIDLGSNNVVYCGYQETQDTLLLDLVNGQYRWVVSQGLGNDYNGYAGVIGAAQDFTVNAPLNAQFSASNGTICSGGTVTFTDGSTGAPTNWTWTFPGGTPASWSGQQPPPIQYNTPGTFNATLVVGDGLTTDPFTLSAAAVVSGGLALPFSHAFEGGFFPPTDWTLQGGGGIGPGGQGGLNWQGDATGSCSQGTSAYVNVYAFTGSFASPMLTSPKLDLTTTVDPYLGFKWSYAPESVSTTETFRVFAHDCAGSVYAQTVQMTSMQMATNGGVAQPSPAWVPTQCSHWKTKLASLSSVQGRTAILDFRLDTQGGQNFFLDDIQVFSGSRLHVRVKLEGPFQSGTGLMSDALRTQSLLPTVEPFTSAGFVFAGEGGGEVTSETVLAVAGNTAIVDWVVVEVRDAVDPTRVITSRAALVRCDGDVVDMDGVSQVRVGVAPGNYHVAVRHRNHLGAMTATPVALGQSMPLLDFSFPATPTWGTAARKTIGSTAVLWAGDVDRNGTIQYTGPGNDRDFILAAIGGVVPTNTVTGYLKEDCTLDGTVKYTGSNSDRDRILQNIGGVVPTNTRVQQIP